MLNLLRNQGESSEIIFIYCPKENLIIIIKKKTLLSKIQLIRLLMLLYANPNLIHSSSSALTFSCSLFCGWVCHVLITLLFVAGPLVFSNKHTLLP